MADDTVKIKTILYEGLLVGSVLSYVHSGNTEVSYWIGREYWGRGIASAALEAFCRVIEAWIAHFHAVAVSVHAVRAIEEPTWRWHIGLDAESTAILNDLWSGKDVEQLFHFFIEKYINAFLIYKVLK